MRGRSTAVLGLIVAVGMFVPTGGVATANGSAAICDINGDGYGESIWGEPGATIGGKEGAGAVYIRWGSASGLSQGYDLKLTQNTSGIKETAGTNDFFGGRGACGDFDGDGYDDLAVAARGEHIGDPVIKDAGAVNVIYGTASGLDKSRDEVWHQDKAGVKDKAELNDGFGSALATGDFDGDGYDDLAIGVAWEDVGSTEVEDAGAVHVLFGSATGLDAGPDEFWHQNRSGIKDSADVGELFGFYLYVGDFDNDSRDDLVVAAPNEDVNGIADAGQIHVIPGSATGLDSGPDQVWHQDRPGVKGVVEDDDDFGNRVTVGDFNGDGRDDLAVGLPNEDPGGQGLAGRVLVIHGSSSGLDAGTDELWHQNRSGVKDVAEVGDFFGRAVTAADFDGDGYDDLAAGAVGEDIGDPEIANAGAVNVIYGSAGGLSGAKDDFWHQDKPGVLSAAKENESLGFQLARNDYNGDGYAELMMISFGDGFNGNLLYGSAGGLSAAGDQYFTFP